MSVPRTADLGAVRTRLGLWTWMAGGVGALAILVARRPETLVRPQFWGEDGQLLYIGTYFGDLPGRAADQYAGYLIVAMRLVAELERLVPVALAPLVGAALSLGVVVAAAGFVASERMRRAIPDRRARYLSALVILLLPVATETLGPLIDVHFYLGLILFFVALAEPPEGRLARGAELAAVAIIGLTGPWSVLLAPLFLVWAWRRRDRHSVWLAAVVGATALLQVGAYVGSSYRPTGGVPDPLDIAAVVGFRSVVVPVLSPAWASLVQASGLPAWIPVLGMAAVCVGVAAVAIDSLPRSTVASMAYSAVALTAAMAVKVGPGLPVLLSNPWVSSRYFVVPGVLVGIVIAAGVARATAPGAPPGRTRSTAVVLGVVMVAGWVGGFGLPAQPDLDWPTASGCIGGDPPCRVPVVPPEWTIEWPGRDGPYVPVPAAVSRAAP